MWSSTTIDGPPRLLIVDASGQLESREVSFGRDLFRALNRRSMLVGEKPLKIDAPEQYSLYREIFDQANCVLLFVRASEDNSPASSRLVDYWEWLNANLDRPKLFFGCSWESYDPAIVETVLNSKITFAPIALIPQMGVTPREVGLFCLKFFTELTLHSGDHVTGKMAWFSASKAKELMRRRGFHVSFGLRC